MRRHTCAMTLGWNWMAGCSGTDARPAGWISAWCTGLPALAQSVDTAEVEPDFEVQFAEPHLKAHQEAVEELRDFLQERGSFTVGTRSKQRFVQSIDSIEGCTILIRTRADGPESFIRFSRFELSRISAFTFFRK